MTEPESPAPPSTVRRIVNALAWILLAGIVGGAAWEWLAKPGLTTVGRIILDIATGLSTKLRDSIYAGAALDPTITPSILVFGEMNVALFSALTMATVILTISRIRLQKPKPRLKQIRPSARRKLALASNIAAVLAGLASLVSWSIRYGAISQASRVRRTFMANVAICRPFLTDLDEKKILARFAAIRTKENFDAVDRDLHRIAEANKIERLWSPDEPLSP